MTLNIPILVLSFSSSSISILVDFQSPGIDTDGREKGLDLEMLSKSLMAVFRNSPTDYYSWSVDYRGEVEDPVAV
jgi:hypothetical protein